jgi:hypothetical protein
MIHYIFFIFILFIFLYSQTDFTFWTTLIIMNNNCNYIEVSRNSGKCDKSHTIIILPVIMNNYHHL